MSNLFVLLLYPVQVGGHLLLRLKEALRLLGYQGVEQRVGPVQNQGWARSRLELETEHTC